jgi:hypothetical protein
MCLSARSSVIALFVIAAASWHGLPDRAAAATLDTPAVADPGATGTFTCTFSNLHTANTANIATATSGLYSAAGVLLIPFTNPTAAPGVTVFTMPIICPSFACRCHVLFTGIPKARSRGALSTNVAGSIAGY